MSRAIYCTILTCLTLVVAHGPVRGQEAGDDLEPIEIDLLATWNRAHPDHIYRDYSGVETSRFLWEKRRQALSKPAVPQKAVPQPSAESRKINTEESASPAGPWGMLWISVGFILIFGAVAGFYFRRLHMDDVLGERYEFSVGPATLRLGGNCSGGHGASVRFGSGDGPAGRGR